MLQPLDQAVLSVIDNSFRGNLFNGGQPSPTDVDRGEFIMGHDTIRQKRLKPKALRFFWEITGLFPFDRDQVFKFPTKNEGFAQTPEALSSKIMDEESTTCNTEALPRKEMPIAQSTESLPHKPLTEKPTEQDIGAQPTKGLSGEPTMHPAEGMSENPLTEYLSLQGARTLSITSSIDVFAESIMQDTAAQSKKSRTSGASYKMVKR
ncbi:Gad1 glutamate decarboxylase [Candida orthopsilosis Co 90-125]|uniref:Gad1 glutamate decarboxylase n=1 Tax=Candida orthopsilosis (strain 90-125) TaxID=1136231 RepID=H8WWM5_CANO9|nr:Gad1 glutamate decarboxylase [Candida orthopsilosis Co 90-125]CCG20849.1 Gad1 glutamate decarboxylase [Candida orthopsilosis Co 90-125]